MNAYERRLQRLESRPKPAEGASSTTLAKLVDLGETQAVAKWPQTQRVFELLRVAQERRKANKRCI